MSFKNLTTIFIGLSFVFILLLGIFSTSSNVYGKTYTGLEEIKAITPGFGVEGGLFFMGPHKGLKNYSYDSGFYGQLNILFFNIAYNKAELLLNDEKATPFNISDTEREATMEFIQASVETPIPIIVSDNFSLVPTINVGIWPWYRFTLSDEAYEKLGETNLTKLKNGASKTGGNYGLGLRAIIFKRITLRTSYSIHYVYEDWGWYDFFTAGIYSMAKDKIETFTDFRVGMSIGF